jgi:hypothetical protein
MSAGVGIPGNRGASHVVLLSGGESLDREQATSGVEDRSLMGIGMGVDPTDDRAVTAGHPGHVVPFCEAGDRVPGRADTTAMGQLFSGRFLSGHIRPDRSPLKLGVGPLTTDASPQGHQDGQLLVRSGIERHYCNLPCCL